MAMYTGYVTGINVHNGRPKTMQSKETSQCYLFSEMLKGMREELSKIEDPLLGKYFRFSVFEFNIANTLIESMFKIRRKSLTQGLF
jgi:hypothetical protein